ncbi:MAG TPA: hypothetical protein VFG72_13930 [Marmoricola sp.]|nr:hypothetical protein [Marmoricola sp.]
MSESTPDAGTQNTEPERDNPSSGNPQTAPAAEGDTAPTEHEPGGVSTAAGTTGGDPGSISDDQLPEDLQPSDDNPLAQPADPDADEDKGMSLGEDGPQP